MEQARPADGGDPLQRHRVRGSSSRQGTKQIRIRVETENPRQALPTQDLPGVPDTAKVTLIRGSHNIRLFFMHHDFPANQNIAIWKFDKVQ